MPEPLLQASSSPLPPLTMSRCKIQAQRLSIAGSRLRASELRQRFFVHTQQDVILCPGLMVQPCLHTSLPINNHVTYNCAAGVARDSRSVLPFPSSPLLRRIIHLQNLSKLTDKHMDKVRRTVHAKLKPFNFQIIILQTYYLKRHIIFMTRIIQWITLPRLIIRLQCENTNDCALNRTFSSICL